MKFFMSYRFLHGEYKLVVYYFITRDECNCDLLLTFRILPTIIMEIESKP